MIGVAQVIGMKPTLRSFFSGAPPVREDLGRGLDREELRERGQRRGGADRLQERPARGVVREHRAHHRRGNDAFVALVLACHRLAAQRLRGMLVFGRGSMLAADAGRLEAAIGIKRIIERGHLAPLASRRTGPAAVDPRRLRQMSPSGGLSAAGR